MFDQPTPITAWPQTVKDRARGAMLGLAVGDALGGPVEFMTKREIEQQHGRVRRMLGGGWLKLKPGQVTDDTQMTLALADAMIGAQGWNLGHVCDHFAEWLKSGPIDVGNTCRRGIQRYILHGIKQGEYSEGDAGNGALMRNLPVVLGSLADPVAMRARSIEQAHITHHHPLSDRATLCFADMTRALVLGGGMADCRSFVNSLIERNRGFRFQPYKGPATAYVVDTVKTVLHHFFRTDNFEDCVVDTVCEGDDADTTGALAGMLAGALYGYQAIPQKWLRKLDPKVFTRLHDRVDRLLTLSLEQQP